MMQYERTSPDQDGNAVHRIGPIALGVPVAGHVRLHDAALVRGAAPDLEIPIARQLQRGRPALPIVAVLGWAQGGTLPARTEIQGDVHRPHGEVARPGGTSQLDLARVGAEPGAV